MSVRGLHQILDDAPDATRSFRTKIYERHNPKQVSYEIVTASLDSVVEKTKSLMSEDPNARSIVFEFPNTSHGIICYKLPSGDIGCFRGLAIK